MTIEDYRDQARAQWGRATPWRTGWMVGLADDTTVACPYHPSTQAAALFKIGALHGKAYRAKAQEAHAKLTQ